MSELLTERDGRVLRLTIDREEKRNALSGDVLRGWLALSRNDFYDTSRIAIVPAGLCYPGTVDGADLPPPPLCARLWQPRSCCDAASADTMAACVASSFALP